MKKQIRNSVFETNSSSTHSICISKKPVLATGKHVDFYIGDYGWEHDSVDPASYLYTAILCMSDSEELIEQLKDVLNRNKITYSFAKPDYSEEGWLNNGYVDHSYDTRDFIDTVLSNEDMLIRYLFGDSYVYTGNDNGGSYFDMCYAAYETIWDDNYKQIPNPNHDSKNYDYFFKGN